MINNVFVLQFEKKVCLKRISCLEVRSIASFQICRINQNGNLEIPTVWKQSFMECLITHSTAPPVDSIPSAAVVTSAYLRDSKNAFQGTVPPFSGTKQFLFPAIFSTPFKYISSTSLKDSGPDSTFSGSLFSDWKAPQHHKPHAISRTVQPKNRK